MTTTAKRLANVVVLVAMLALLVALMWAWWVPPASADTPGDVDDLGSCLTTLERSTVEGFMTHQALDEAERRLDLVEAERARLSEEVRYLDRTSERQARAIVRLRVALRKARR